MKNDDIIGKKFNRLTVIEKIGSKNSISIYKCLCDCGNYKNIFRTSLTNKTTKSCGCLKKEYSKKSIQNIKKYHIENTNISSIKSNKLNKNNTSGVKGVHQSKRNGKWIAQMTFKKKHYNLGTYENKEDAIKARKDAEEKRDEYLRSKGLL